ncbi:DUF362 domain-containing protein [Tundrisphaera sp. TA3]|uniref:DUF362 domain-containing protein n=1 Tax=Tundrisphaera sp. TA3 TaxID=3435775 RepID=UPI003EBB96F5
MSPEDALTVSIADVPGDIDKSITRALSDITLDDFKDKVVAIKPNDTTATKSDKTACTQADSLRATIRHIKTLHPRKIIVSGGAGAMETEEVFKVLGFMEVIEEEGVEWFDHNKAPFVGVDLPFGPQRRVMVNPRVLEYEKLVSLAQLKVHQTATVTLAIKNIAMSYPAADFYGHPRVSQKLHPHNILDDKQAFLVGMLMRFPIDLSIVVGHPAMIGKGPVGGKAIETGITIAGRDAVAVDTVGAYLLGFETLAVQHLHQAAKLGLGIPYAGSEQATKPGVLRFKGVSVEAAVKSFRKSAYGEAF